MNKKGWKPFRRQKKPLLTEKQRRARLKFAKQYKHLTALEWEDFLFSDECPKYLFQLPNPKNDVAWGSQESQVPPAYQVKGSSKWLIWGGMAGRGHPASRAFRFSFSSFLEELREVLLAGWVVA